MPGQHSLSTKHFKLSHLKIALSIVLNIFFLRFDSHHNEILYMIKMNDIKLACHMSGRLYDISALMLTDAECEMYNQ